MTISRLHVWTPSSTNDHTSSETCSTKYSAEDGRIDLTEGTNARTLLSLLLDNPRVGFTPVEFHDQTGIPWGSVNPTLARLERAGLVRHKGDYWAAEDDDRVAAATASVLGLAAVAQTYDDNWTLVTRVGRTTLKI